MAIMQIAQTIEEMMRPAAAPLARHLIENPELAKLHDIDFELTPKEVEDIVYLRDTAWAWEIDYEGGCDWD